MESPEVPLTVLVIGPSQAGKSSLIRRFVSEDLDEEYTRTSGIDCKLVRLTLQGKKVKLFLWDTSDESLYANLFTAFQSRIGGIFLVYDVTASGSIEQLQDTFSFLEQQADSNIKIVLVGNKSDLSDHRCISYAEGRALADSKGAFFIETSAKSDVNTEVALKSLLLVMLEVQASAPA